jgi:hypothetical protein
VFEEMTFFKVKVPTKASRKSEEDNETLNSGIGYEINWKHPLGLGTRTIVFGRFAPPSACERPGER